MAAKMGKVDTNLPLELKAEKDRGHYRIFWSVSEVTLVLEHLRGHCHPDWWNYVTVAFSAGPGLPGTDCVEMGPRRRATRTDAYRQLQESGERGTHGRPAALTQRWDYMLEESRLPVAADGPHECQDVLRGVVPKFGSGSCAANQLEKEQGAGSLVARACAKGSCRTLSRRSTSLKRDLGTTWTQSPSSH